MGVDPSQVKEREPEHKPDYTRPIARTGEQQFACVLRNRSGQDSGEIDMGTRDITHLSDHDQQQAIEAAYSIYLTWRGQTGKRSSRDYPPAA